MYCRMCGKQLPDEAFFCAGCGIKIQKDKKEIKEKIKLDLKQDGNFVKKEKFFNFKRLYSRFLEMERPKISVSLMIGIMVIAAILFVCVFIKKPRNYLVSISNGSYQVWNQLEEGKGVQVSSCNYDAYAGYDNFFSEDGKYMYFYSKKNSEGTGTLCRVKTSKIKPQNSKKGGLKEVIDKNVDYLQVACVENGVVYSKEGGIYYFDGKYVREIEDSYKDRNGLMVCEGRFVIYIDDYKNMMLKDLQSESDSKEIACDAAFFAYDTDEEMAITSNDQNFIYYFSFQDHLDRLYVTDIYQIEGELLCDGCSSVAVTNKNTIFYLDYAGDLYIYGKDVNEKLQSDVERIKKMGEDCVGVELSDGSFCFYNADATKSVCIDETAIDGLYFTYIVEMSDDYLYLLDDKKIYRTELSSTGCEDRIMELVIFEENASFVGEDENGLYYRRDQDDSYGDLCELCYVSEDKVKVLAKNIENSDNELYFDYYEDGTVLVHEYEYGSNGYREKATYIDKQGRQTNISNDIGYFIKIDRKTILYIENHELKLFNGKKTKVLDTGVDSISTFRSMKERIREDYGCF